MKTTQAVAAIERIIVAAGQSDFSRETIANARAGLDALLSELQTMRQSKEHESERVQSLLHHGVTLATLCDMVLGADAADRSDDALVRAVGELQRERDAATKRLERPKGFETTAKERAELVVSWIQRQGQENFYLGTLEMNLVAEFEAAERAARNAAILELEKRIAELEADYNEMSLQNEHIVKENGVSVERIAELERERDAATKRAEQAEMLLRVQTKTSETLNDYLVKMENKFNAATLRAEHAEANFSKARQRAEQAERERDAAIAALKLAPEAIKNIYDMLDFIQAQSPQSVEGLRYVHIRTAQFQEALKAIEAK